MLVQAKKGARCPKERKNREYITDREPVDVPESAYYLRLIADGSLVEIAKTSGEQPPPEPPPAQNTTSPCPLQRGTTRGGQPAGGGQSKKGGKE